MSEALGLDGITRHFRQGPRTLEVLRGVDLSIAEGETVALVAPSGAGKSTLLQIAGLLDTPTAGTVTIAGREVSSSSGSRSAGRLPTSQRSCWPTSRPAISIPRPRRGSSA